jgi:hypothetical protein
MGGGGQATEAVLLDGGAEVGDESQQRFADLPALLDQLS